jgi:hypothetical protein
LSEDASLFTLIHVAKEWGIPPSKVLDWSEAEYWLAVAYLKHIADPPKQNS